MLCIELDDDQHNHYSKVDEESRYNDLLTLHFVNLFLLRRYMITYFQVSKANPIQIP